MIPNTSFQLSVDDISLIEHALSHKLSRLSTRRLTHLESTIIPQEQINSIQDIDDEVRNITDLLGRLHHQKNWYRPRSETYISG